MLRNCKWQLPPQSAGNRVEMNGSGVAHLWSRLVNSKTNDMNIINQPPTRGACLKVNVTKIMVLSKAYPLYSTQLTKINDSDEYGCADGNGGYDHYLMLIHNTYRSECAGRDTALWHCSIMDKLWLQVFGRDVLFQRMFHHHYYEWVIFT